MFHQHSIISLVCFSAPYKNLKRKGRTIFWWGIKKDGVAVNYVCRFFTTSLSVSVLIIFTSVGSILDTMRLWKLFGIYCQPFWLHRRSLCLWGYYADYLHVRNRFLVGSLCEFPKHAQLSQIVQKTFNSRIKKATSNLEMSQEKITKIFVKD